MLKNIFILLLGLVLDVLVKVVVPAYLIKVAVYGIFGNEVNLIYYVLVFLTLRILMFDYKDK